LFIEDLQGFLVFAVAGRLKSWLHVRILEELH
jgi:hypothetical protein